MTVSEFLAWLHLADLEGMSEAALRQRLEQVLEQAPEQGPRLLEEFLDELEEQLEAKRLDRELLAEWPEVYSQLLPEQLAELENLEEALQSRADEVEDVESPHLRTFREILRNLATQGMERQARRDLEALEAEIGKAWDEYRNEPVEPDAASAESVAGHRLLEEGFQCWFEAFELVRAGEPEEALAAAAEGNRLLRVVAEWSDEVTQ